MRARSPSYQETLAWLYSLQRFGIKLGLENIRRLLGELELPAQNQRIVHVAGTNGKGSVCAMIDSICRHQGYRTGLFTSPHLVTFRERIRVNGTMIPEEEVAAILDKIRELVAAWDPHPTFFEIATALGLQHFRQANCEIVVLETGMGGRLDATNALQPVVCVITPIDYDHQKWLGNSLREIAGEKAGIIKTGVPVVSSLQKDEAAEVIQRVAAEKSVPLKFIEYGTDDLTVALPGAHQKENAALAVAALRAGNIKVDPTAIADGLAKVEWPARFQRWDERIVIDGAHNPAGAQILVRTWRELFGHERATVVLAILGDKDIAGIISALEPIAVRFILPQIQAERAVVPAEIYEAIQREAPNVPATLTENVATALALAESGPILITGSLHFAGEALAHLRGEEYEDCAQ